MATLTVPVAPRAIPAGVAVRANPSISNLERWLLEAEGPWHVEGTYHSNLYVAERQRRLVAERVQRDIARGFTVETALACVTIRTLWIEGGVQRSCPACGQDIDLHHDVEVLGRRLVHRVCAEAL